MPTLPRLLFACAALLLCAAAQAQYIWVDDKGIKQFSDRPPPPDTPAKRILKQPGAAPVSDLLAPAADAAPAAPAPGKGPPSIAERNADYRKRMKDQAENDKKAQEESQRKADMASNCASARASKAQLESGVRVGTVDRNGERTIMDDAERAQQLQKANRALQDCP